MYVFSNKISVSQKDNALFIYSFEEQLLRIFLQNGFK